MGRVSNYKCLNLSSHFQCTKQLIYFLGFNFHCMSLCIQPYVLLIFIGYWNWFSGLGKDPWSSNGRQLEENLRNILWAGWTDIVKYVSFKCTLVNQASLNYWNSGFLPSWSVVFEQTCFALSDLSGVSDHHLLLVLETDLNDFHIPRI